MERERLVLEQRLSGRIRDNNMARGEGILQLVYIRFIDDCHKPCREVIHRQLTRKD